jgi:hypothetical protein
VQKKTSKGSEKMKMKQKRAQKLGKNGIVAAEMRHLPPE